MYRCLNILFLLALHTNAAPTKQVSPQADKVECFEHPLDIIFIIDGSNSVSPANFQLVKDFIVKLVRLHDIGPEKTQIGVIQHGWQVVEEISLDAYTTSEELVKAVQAIPHMGKEGSMAGEAFKHLVTETLVTRSVFRTNDPNLQTKAIYITNGGSQDDDTLTKYQEKAKGLGVEVFVIGVGLEDSKERSDLEKIASVPAEKYFLTADEYGAMSEIDQVKKLKPCAASDTEDHCEKGFELDTNGVCLDIDECTQSSVCENRYCSNTIGGYSCECDEGYRFIPEGSVCIDVDECEEYSICQQRCTNTPGAFECSCIDGYVLADDGNGCLELAESDSKTTEDHCEEGYEIASDGTCQDIDECAQSSLCENGFCINIDGGYFCECEMGFSPSPDRTKCFDVDECEEPDLCGSGTCVNHEGHFECLCNEGFEPDYGMECTDIDECYKNNGMCQQKCINSDGSYFCECYEGYVLGPDGHWCYEKSSEISWDYQCDEGYYIGPDGQSCIEINECELFTSLCLDGNCSNTDGGYECLCDKGFAQDDSGHNCVDIDECQHDVCENGTCKNFPGEFWCLCNEGYTLTADLRNCQLSDETGVEYEDWCGPGYTGGYDIGCQDFDECAINNGGCSQTCTNSDGSYQCECNTFWKLDSDGLTCIPDGWAWSCDDGFAVDGDLCTDIDECAVNNGGCSQSCVNYDGSYQCECNFYWRLDSDGLTCITDGDGKIGCPDGFALKEDGYRCSDIDECAINNGNCGDLQCANTIGSRICRCMEGYHLGSDGHTCFDIDECEDYMNICPNGICINLDGGHTCECQEGFELSEDGRTCVDIDECVDCPDDCINFPGSFQCGSMIGMDINECELKNGYCDHLCLNLPGSYKCACFDGFLLASDGLTCNLKEIKSAGCESGYKMDQESSECIDRDECLVNNGHCSHDCINYPGSYDCHCPYDYHELDSDGFSCVSISGKGSKEIVLGCEVGYTIDGESDLCIDIDECAANDGKCEHECINTEGSYWCQCLKGFFLGPDGSSCIDIDECEEPTVCSNGMCHNFDGGFRCECNQGFVINDDYDACVDDDECLVNNGNCSQECYNLLGSYECECDEGYELDSDGFTCIDIDECKDTPHFWCSQICNNTSGGFECACNEGYVLEDDGFTCVET